jgi:Ferric reductase like transmembrane component/Class III cytochrome C family
MRVKGFDGRYVLWGVGILALAATPLIAGYAGVGWELSQLAGLVGVLACIALSGSPIRPREASPPTVLSLRFHTVIGWVALIAVAFHAGGLVLADRTVVEYLKPTAPLYQLAGIVATCLLLVLVVSSLAGVRRRIWTSHRNFQATHVILGCLLAALIAVHVVVTARYMGGRGRRALFVAVTIGAIFMLLRARRSTEDASRKSKWHRRLVFGRHATLVAVVLVITAAAVAGLFPDWVGALLREPLVRRATALPLDFPHGKHTMVNCLTCHHNYVDTPGGDTCVSCHRSNRTDLKEGAEARFHGFCFECHRHPDATFTHHGPVSGCVACHQLPGKNVADFTP